MQLTPGRIVSEIISLAAVVYIYWLLADVATSAVAIFAVGWIVVRGLILLPARRRQHPARTQRSTHS